MKIRELLLASLAATTLWIPTVAHAVIYKISYTGHVTSGYDYAGVFGSPNTDLTGAAYRGTFLLDSNKGNYYEDPYGTYIDSYQWLPYSVPLTSVLKINNVSILNSGNYYSIVGYEDGGPVGFDYDEIITETWEYTKESNNLYQEKQLGLNLQAYKDIISGYGLIPYLSYKKQPSDGGGGYFSVAEYDDSTYSYVKSQGGLDIDRVSIKPVSSGAIPEPSTWALMILGFGGIGATMRGRRKEAQAATAA